MPRDPGPTPFTTIGEMERLEWDVHQCFQEIKSITSQTSEDFILPKCRNTMYDFQYSTTSDSEVDRVDGGINSSRCLFELRRILRRLDRNLQQTESELHNHGIQEEPNETVDNNLCLVSHESKSPCSRNNRVINVAVPECFISRNETLTKPMFRLDDINSSSDDGYDEETQPTYKSTLSKQLLADLHFCLAELPLAIKDDNAFTLATSILETTSRILMNFVYTSTGSQFCDQMAETLVCLLDRVIQYDRQVYNRMVENPDQKPRLLKPLGVWLDIVNDFLITEEETFDQVRRLPSFEALSPSFLFRIVPDFVVRSNKILKNEHWESSGMSDPVVELYVQWRILTGRLLCRLIKIQEHSSESNPMSSMFHFITEFFVTMEGNEDDPTNQQYQDLQKARRRAEGFMASVVEYASELTDFAIDAIDGATVASMKKLRTINSSKSNYRGKRSRDDCQDDYTLSEVAIQDCFRHITLAIDLQLSLKAWKHHSGKEFPQTKQARRSLWHALSTAFLSPTSNGYGNGKHREQIGSRICHFQLVLTNLLWTTDGFPSSEDDELLTLTFLRLLEYPDLVLSSSAQYLWDSINARVNTCNESNQGTYSSNIAIKEVLQTAYITLQYSSMSDYHHAERNVESPFNKSNMKSEEVMSKLFEILTFEQKSDRNENLPELEQEPMHSQSSVWDKLFKQLLHKHKK